MIHLTEQTLLMSSPFHALLTFITFHYYLINNQSFRVNINFDVVMFVLKP